jgi:hypothetical protein
LIVDNRKLTGYIAIVNHHKESPMSTYKRHELSQIFPDMDESEVALLADDIKSNGQHDVIYLLDGKVLDGWHRYQACMRAGVHPMVQDYRGKSPADFVWSKNGHRRNMTASQKALAAVQVFEWADAGKPKGEPGSPLPMKNSQLAEIADTTGRTIQQAKTVEVKGSKALKELVKSGEVSVKKAATVAKLPKREQVAALDVEAEESGKVDTVAELERADLEIRKLTEQVKSLSVSDVAKELATWQAKFYQLEGRLAQCMTTKGEIEKQAKAQGDVLAKVRKMLDVERNGDICRAIMDLKR